MGLISTGDAPEVWAEVNPEFPDFEVLVQYLSPAAAKKISEAATSKQVNRKSRQVEDVTDNDKYARLMIKEMVRDWRGLQLGYLEQMVPLSEDSRKSIKKEGGEVPFSVEDLEFLADNTYARSFLDGVMELSMDLEAMVRAQRMSAEKN
jgi:transcription termination factor NusB